MSAELLVRRFFDAYNDGDARALAAAFTDAAVVEYVGGREGARTYAGKQALAKLFKGMVERKRGPVSAAHAAPKVLFAREGVAAVEWSTVVADKEGNSVTTRGVNVCEVEGDRFRKMTIYLPHPSRVLHGSLEIKDLGELSLMAWAIV